MPKNEVFDDLDGYEKGVVARAFLKGMIKQGKIDDFPDVANRKSELVIPIEHWQLKLLSFYADEEKSGRQRLIEELCQLR